MWAETSGWSKMSNRPSRQTGGPRAHGRVAPPRIPPTPARRREEEYAVGAPRSVQGLDLQAKGPGFPVDD